MPMVAAPEIADSNSAGGRRRRNPTPAAAPTGDSNACGWMRIAEKPKLRAMRVTVS